MVSVVCPFYNEESGIASAIGTMRGALESLGTPWELIMVDDGSRDNSRERAREAAGHDPRIRILGYEVNRGRGHAIRYGVERASGDLVVTTEADCSWGTDIVRRIVECFRAHPDADMVIASPHLPGGGYRNVPLRRVLISKIGNAMIRRGLTHRVTMFTGMTRGYRREKFAALALDEDGKELHLEIINKALALGYRIYEVPAVLAWNAEDESGRKKRRKSSTRLGPTMRTHLLFSFTAAPFRYLRVLAVLLLLLGVVTLAAGRVLLSGRGEGFLLVLAVSVFVLAGLQFLVLGVNAQQLRHVQESLWRIQSMLQRLPETEERREERHSVPTSPASKST